MVVIAFENDFSRRNPLTAFNRKTIGKLFTQKTKPLQIADNGRDPVAFLCPQFSRMVKLEFGGCTC